MPELPEVEVCRRGLQPEVAGHMHDYGTKFLVTAGLLNVLAMVDAYEIASGKKT